MTNLIIEVKNFSKTYIRHKTKSGLKGAVLGLFKREKVETKAVDNLSFQIKEGEIIGFLGPNGAGKTTTLKMLAGILYPTSGEAQVNGFIPSALFRPADEDGDYRRFNPQAEIILTSHYTDTEDIKSLCEKVIIINHDRKIFDGALAKLVKERLKNKIIKIVYSEPFTNSLDQFGTVLKRDDLSVELAINREKAVAISGEILSSLPVADIIIEEPEAEEVIREMFQNH